MISSVSKNLVEKSFRGKYFVNAQGVEILYQVQGFSSPVFREAGFELPNGESRSVVKRELSFEEQQANAIKGQRRAQRLLYDLALCNLHLDAFITLTLAETAGFDRSSYDDAYGILRPWLSNRVQRRGLCYVLVPERHKKGGIHFHALCNSDALRLEKAINPRTGRTITDKGQTVYNVTDWSRIGFSTAKIIGDNLSDRAAVAKYVSKYMTKDVEKIGGRYVLHGGRLNLPVERLGDCLADFTDEPAARYYEKETEDFSYKEWNFL